MSILPDFAHLRARNSTGVPDASGWPTWDRTKVQQAQLIVGITLASSTIFPVGLSTNSGAADAVAGVDEWEWYLSQRSDVTARQYIKMYHPTSTGLSGTVALDIVVAGSAGAPATVWTPTTVDNLYRLFVDCFVYARHISDGKIYMLDVARKAFSFA